MVRCQSSGSGRSPRTSSSAPSVHRCVRHRLGCCSRVRPLVRLIDSGELPIFHQSSGTSCHSICHPRFSPSSPRAVGLTFHGQRLGSCLPPQTRGTRSATLNSVAQTILCLYESNDVHLLPQFVPGKLNVLADSLGRDSQVLGSEWTLCQEVCRELFHRWSANIDLFCHINEPPSASLLLPGGGAPGTGHRRDDPVLGRPPGVCLPFIRLHSECSGQGPPVSESGGHSSSSLLASETVVPGYPGTSGGYSGPSPSMSGLTPPASLPSFSWEPPSASHDWVLYCQRTARHLGFSLAVARQLAFCRRSSTRVNYQARWSSYLAWCRRQGHSVSRPTIAKIADFLLYLRRSLHLSYSSIASYCSMLIAVFRFVLPDISSHPVLHDLLRSFRIESPLLSSRFPPWDLLRVLSLLRGPPFEPLTSCSLRDLTWKGLFLVALATARRVGELQAVSLAVSFSGEDLFLSYLPEFRAKTESTSNLLSRSFVVRSLRDFVGSLPDELLLCPVRAVRVYVSRTSSVSPRPRSLFVSPRTPTRPISKNTLSYFLRSVILHPCPLLRPPPRLSGLILYDLFQLPRRFCVMLLCLISLLRLRGALTRFLPHFTSVMYSLLWLMGLVWVLLLLQAQFFISMVLIFLFIV